MTKTFLVEIWRNGSNRPLIQYGLTQESSKQLYDSAAHGWSIRRIVNSNNGSVIKEEKKLTKKDQRI